MRPLWVWLVSIQACFADKKEGRKGGGGGGHKFFAGPILGLAWIIGYDPPGGAAHRSLDENRFVHPIPLGRLHDATQETGCMTRNCLTLALGLVLGAAWPVSAQMATLSASAAVEAPRAVRAGAHSAAALLHKRVDKVDWVETTFEEVIDWLHDEGMDKVNIVPRWGPLGVEGIGRETPVTLRLNSTTVGGVLNETLGQLSESEEVTYRGIGNTLRISTKQDFGRKMELKIYDVTDILFQVPDFGREAPIIDLQQASRSGGGGGGGSGGQGVFGGSSSGTQQQTSGEQAKRLLDEKLKELRELIEAAIAPESWTSGGGRGTINAYNQSLVVYNTIEVHEKIAGLFSYGE